MDLKKKLLAYGQVAYTSRMGLNIDIELSCVGIMFHCNETEYDLECPQSCFLKRQDYAMQYCKLKLQNRDLWSLI